MVLQLLREYLTARHRDALTRIAIIHSLRGTIQLPIIKLTSSFKSTAYFQFKSLELTDCSLLDS